MKSLFFTVIIATIIGTSGCAESIATPLQRNAENIVWVASHYEKAQEAERLTIEIAKFELKEIHCLAENIYHEARGEPDIGQVAVAWVTINRQKSELFPDTICKVVYQPSQFSWVYKGHVVNTSNSTYLEIRKMAEDLYYNQETQYDITKGATYFHASYVNPSWARRFTLIISIGLHKFYKDNRV